jgi:IS5 family transposase
VPWVALTALNEPHGPKASKKGGRPPYPLATMLRIHLLQQRYSLSDPAMEEALIEVPTMRRFAGIELISDRIPDVTTILMEWLRHAGPWTGTRHPLEKHDLGEQIYCYYCAEDFVYETVKAHLSERGMTMRQVTIVDVTLIVASSSICMREQPEYWPGGQRTKRGRVIQRCTRPRRATSGLLECIRRPSSSCRG